MKTETPRPIQLKDYRPPEFLITHVDLDVSLHATRTVVRSRLKVKHNPAVSEPASVLKLDGEGLVLQSIRLDGEVLEPSRFSATTTGLSIGSVPTKAFVLEIVTIIDPESNKALQGLYRSRGIYCTQCEAQGFRRITYFLDRPDVLSVYRVRIEADSGDAPVLLSNGNPVERGTLDQGRRHYAVWQDPHPKPCYLFALVGGNLGSIASTFKTASGRAVDLRIYCEPGKESRCAWAMDALKRSMRWDEQRFGREYDLDIFMIVAVSDFNMGAMENKGLNIFNDRLILASADTATDQNFEDIEAVIAHEYFHNWTGNRITCRDWFQLCLKEGLTVYRDQEFSADERSAAVQRIIDVRQLKARQFPEDSGPLAHPVRTDRYIEINNFYTATVYEKGAELCRMIESIVGKPGFRKGMDLYFERHDGEAATVEDFVRSFEDANQVDLAQFMTWYAQAGTPGLVCKLEWDRRKKEALLTVEQVLPATPDEAKKKPLHIPLRLGLVGGNGQDIELRLDGGEAPQGGLLHVTRRKESFRFTNVSSRPVPSLLRGFSAPVNLTVDLSDRDLEFLLANDSDLYNRWQAAQTFASRTIIAIVEVVRAGKRSNRGLSLARALGASLVNDDLEPAYRAQLMRLPADADIAREIGTDVDPAAIHRARRQVLKLVGVTLGDVLEEIYRRNEQRGAYSPAAVSAGKRSLRNTALGLLHARGTPADLKRTFEHFRKAKNLTDQLTGLALLSDTDTPERTEALQQFHDRWRDDHLVIDHWLICQATSSLSSTLETVRALTTHPVFSLKNPNKVRSLIGAFCGSNQLQFNRPDGAGYEFLAEQVLAIESFNPQVAARLLGALRSWRTLEPGRRKLARKALEKVAAKDGLSRDVYEIVTKILE